MLSRLKQIWHDYFYYITTLLVCLAIGLGLIDISSTERPLNGPSINLISNQDWSHFAGAIQTNEDVHISPLGREIVNQDGSGGQLNPPVNVRGPHLLVDGNFKINATVSKLPSIGPASLYIYGKVPNIYDEWRYQPPQIRLDIYQNKLVVSVWNGSSDSIIDQKTWQTSPSSQPQVALVSQGRTISFEVNQQKVGSLSDHGIFAANQVWFGADAPVGSGGWDLDALEATGHVEVEAGVTLKTTAEDKQSLKNLALANSRHLPIGAAIANYALFSDSSYRTLTASQFNMITPENEMKAQFIHPQPDVYSFTEADSLVDFALANGMSIHGHNLVFSEANPKWMQSSPLKQRQQILTNHIKAVVNHFGTRVGEWDVVDEPLNDNDDNNDDSTDLRQNIWFAAMGEEYIDTAFLSARAANPKAALYLNEYGLEADGPRWDEFLALINRLQARGVPIDGIGFQAHIYEPGDEVNQNVLENHIRMLARLGLKSRVSELDVYGDEAGHQADQYAVVLQACLGQPSCTSVTIWGLTDRYGSTTDYHTYPLSYGNDLLWDSNLQPKPAYVELQNVLQNNH